MKKNQYFLYPMLLAWRQLAFDRRRFLTAISGVAFACVLIFMQLGFMDALFESAILVIKNFNGDLFLLSRQSEAFAYPAQFPRSRLMQALGINGVTGATPVYFGLIPWENPTDKGKHTAMVLGIDPSALVFSLPSISNNISLLKQPDAVMFDLNSQPFYGDILNGLKKGWLYTELGQKKVHVVAGYQLGATFIANGSAITSDINFIRIFPYRQLESIDLGVITVSHKVDIPRIQSELSRVLPNDVRVMTKKEFEFFEINFWKTNTPIGFVFILGSALGFIVGMVIVYQIIYSDIQSHIREYAALRAMGYRQNYFVFLVLYIALYMSVFGYIPGIIISALLYHFTESATFLPMRLYPEKCITVFFLIVSMCIISGVLSVRKIKDSDPANVFR